MASGCTLRTLNCLAFTSVLAINWLAGQSKIGDGVSAVSAAHPTMITPSGWTFAIWVPIYALLFSFCCYQLFEKAGDTRVSELIGEVFVANCVFNIAWILLWCNHYVGLSVPVILLMTATAGVLYGRTYYWFIDLQESEAGWIKYVAIRLPFSVYFSWLLVASVLSVLVATATDDSVWKSFFAICIIAVLQLGVAYDFDDPVVAAVGVWALCGIASRTDAPVLFWTAVVCAVVCATAICLMLLAPVVSNCFGGRHGDDKVSIVYYRMTSLTTDETTEK